MRQCPGRPGRQPGQPAGAETVGFWRSPGELITFCVENLEPPQFPIFDIGFPVFPSVVRYGVGTGGLLFLLFCAANLDALPHRGATVNAQVTSFFE